MSLKEPHRAAMDFYSNDSLRLSVPADGPIAGWPFQPASGKALDAQPVVPSAPEHGFAHCTEAQVVVMKVADALAQSASSPNEYREIDPPAHIELQPGQRCEVKLAAVNDKLTLVYRVVDAELMRAIRTYIAAQPVAKG